MKFTSWEEAESKFYETHDCVSDDSDKEGARIEQWVEYCGHEVIEEKYTKKEWEELKLEEKEKKEFELTGRKIDKDEYDKSLE